MTNDKLIKFNRILLGIIVSLTILLILVYIFESKISNEVIQKFLSIYFVSFLLFLVYMLIVTLIQLKNLNKEDLKDRIIKFIKGSVCYFIFLGLLSVFLKPDNIDLFHIATISFGGSFGFNFLDLLFFRNTNKSNWY